MTYSFEHDDLGGNILNKKKYAYTTGTVGTVQQTIAYTYGDTNWKDKLTAYNGTTLTYDNMGNITNDGTWTYAWAAGRQLSGMSKSGTEVEFDYDHNGLRIRKTVSGVTTNYTLNGKLVVHLTKGSDWMHFYYDAQGRPAMVNFNGTKYHYLHNLQGDIIGIVDASGTIVVEYKYDAWGKIIARTGSLVSTLGYLNPFRYRGYVYDEETGLYYLRSRYYNPEWGRFINADSIIRGNLFEYCSNSPVSCADYTGKECISCIMGGESAIRYELNQFDSALFSQWLTGEYKLEDLVSLTEKIFKMTKDDMLSSGMSSAVDHAFTQGAKKIFSGTKGLSVSMLLEKLYSTYEVFAIHDDATADHIVQWYTQNRSNAVSNQGAIVDVFCSGREITLSITVIAVDGISSTAVWTDATFFDAVHGTPLSQIAKYLENTFMPIHHGHPSWNMTYSEYSWN